MTDNTRDTLTLAADELFAAITDYCDGIIPNRLNAAYEAYKDARWGARKPQPGDVWRHKNGNSYTVLHLALMQNKAADTDMDEVVVYSDTNKCVWTRSLSEFTDGRFTYVENRK